MREEPSFCVFFSLGCVTCLMCKSQSLLTLSQNLLEKYNNMNMTPYEQAHDNSGDEKLPLGRKKPLLNR